MSSVYEIRDGESGRISQCLCIRNEAAIHARDGGGKGVEVTCARVDEDDEMSSCWLLWHKNVLAGLDGGTKTPSSF